MATVTFTSTNYSAGTCVFTPSDANHSETNLGSITFPFTFNPLAYSLPAEIIEGAFEFTVGGCVFTKQVARSATSATSATTQATNATNATVPPTNATAATTQGSGSGSGGGSGETQATAATTLASAATVPPTSATEATTEIQARYNVIDDTTEDNSAKVGTTFAFRIETSGVREGTTGTFTYLKGAPENGNASRAGGPEGQPFEGEPGTFTIDANGIGSIFIKVEKAVGDVEIQLERLDNDGNATRELVSDSIKLVTDGEEPGPVTAATTLATEATNATEAPTSATDATTLATNATEAPTNATAATTLATSATAAPTAETNATEATMAPVVTEATEATEATTINEATEATEATIRPTTPTEGTEATAAPTSATDATTLATSATVAPTEGTEATQATVTPTEGTEATIRPTTPTEGTEATAAPTLATEATAAPTSATDATTLATSATVAPTLATEATEATTQASSGDGSGFGDGDPTNPTPATTQAESQSLIFTNCNDLGDRIFIDATDYEAVFRTGSLPVSGDTLLSKETEICYTFTGGSTQPRTHEAGTFTFKGCRCEGELGGAE